jgi:hypothetical protein
LSNCGFVGVTIYRLTRTGTSKKLKKIVCKRHLVYVAFYSLFLYKHVINLFCSELLESTAYQVIDNVLTVALCFGLAYLRLSEPYVAEELKRTICRCKNQNEKKEKLEDEGLISFLNSA